jgi:hypothetical protein
MRSRGFRCTSILGRLSIRRCIAAWRWRLLVRVTIGTGRLVMGEWSVKKDLWVRDELTGCMPATTLYY